jgi:hypothetical protein
MWWLDSNNSQLPTPNFQYHAERMTDPDLRRRLDALIAALASPATARLAPADAAAPLDADAQRVATMQVDELLRRVAALTGVLGADGRGWDEVDQLAAKLLLSDLGTIASTTRAINDLAASRLAGALADLRAAGADVQRAMKDASDS